MSAIPTLGVSRLHVLVVEDDVLVRETILMMLEAEYDASGAGTVQAATVRLQARGQSDIACVVLDCMLPNGNFDDVLAEADRRAIPVVLISGDPRLAARFPPERRFLAKPFSQQKLFAAIRAVILSPDQG